MEPELDSFIIDPQVLAALEMLLPFLIGFAP